MIKTRNQPTGDRNWKWGAAVLSVVVVFPLAALVWIATSPAGDIWGHLITTVLPGSFATTLWLMVGVGVITIVIGVSTAWLVTMCEFPGRRYMDWALLVPLAVPTYIVAFAYVEVFDYTGPLQTWLRWAFGFKNSRDYWFPELRSLGGAIFVMSMVLYPYVYLTTRASFMIQSASLLDVSRTLGATPTSLFFRVALPLSRPAIAIGASLALMECLNDIGAVTFFGVRTLTFSVYDIWLNRSSLAAASQLSLAMLLMVFALLWLERQGRKRQKFHSHGAAKHRMPLRFQLSTRGSVLALVVCLLPILLGFVVPALLLADSASRRLDELFSDAFLSAAGNTLTLAIIASLVTVAVSVVLAYALRLRPGRKLQSAVRLASIGYAIPGTVLAIGILIPLAALDNFIAGQAKVWLGFSTGLLLIGNGTGIVYAYVIRFLAVSYGQIESGLAKISPHLDMAARTLGRTETNTLVQVHLPILKPVLLSALLLTFVDCMKELPATILLRPFNFETLATTVFEAASREAFGEAALPSLAIVLVGLLPVIFLARTSATSFRTKTTKRLAPADPVPTAPAE
ncbi:ABC transporter, membrane spanning protein [Roseibium sp. TrichSKD4]|uniref:ABC transporter permease n=1 Tax=Roseibium sp. TrichSKD4 TaxID=744980 RepID=UPI0001E5728E|nr:iron ABC transporter permease [Roseibium sp. TrichSKD4]EFO28489.1 ABC transporter, membrane spanning protein [Roseibium sp. TrichSKD4]